MKIGDFVRTCGNPRIGKVCSVDGDNIDVVFGGLRRSLNIVALKLVTDVNVGDMVKITNGFYENRIGKVLLLKISEGDNTKLLAKIEFDNCIRLLFTDRLQCITLIK